MAWNPSPKVAAARDFGNKFDKDKVIIISINEAKGQFEVTTFGKNKVECGKAKLIGNQIFNLMEKGEIKIQ